MLGRWRPRESEGNGVIIVHRCCAREVLYEGMIIYGNKNT